MTGRPRAVLFDLDETLYPERRFALSGFAAIARATAIDGDLESGRIFRVLAGALRRRERATALQQLCAAFGWSASLVPALVQIYRGHEPNLRLPEVSRRTLAALRAGWSLGIVTNGLPSIQRAKVHSLALDGCVDTIVYAAECGSGEGKPASEPFAVAARALGVPPSRCVFVGDDPGRDVIGARRAGMKTIRVRQGVHAGAVVGVADDADAVTGSLVDVPRLAALVLGETVPLCA